MAILQTMLSERKSEDEELLWQEWVNFVPTRFILLSEQGMEPELAADLADDGLPVYDNLPKIAEDDELVVIWPGMYEEVA